MWRQISQHIYKLTASLLYYKNIIINRQAGKDIAYELYPRTVGGNWPKGSPTQGQAEGIRPSI